MSPIENIIYFCNLMDSTDAIDELEEIKSMTDCPRATMRDIDDKIERILQEQCE